MYFRVSKFNSCLYIKNILPVLLSEIFLLLIFSPTKSLGQKVENVQNLSSSELKPIQENKGHVKKEYEEITVRYFFSQICH